MTGIIIMWLASHTELKTKAEKFLGKKPEDDEITKESPEPEPEKTAGTKGE